MQHFVERNAGRHKMLGAARMAASAIGLAMCLAVFGLLQFQKARFVFLSDGIHFVDSDCYSRMTRAQIVAQQPGMFVHEHAFENYPFGIRPHTTAPMDYLIVGASWLLGKGMDLDFAGAWLSPFLGACLIVLAWSWAELRRLDYRWSMVVLLATSPVLLHGFAVGRPDHQSLVLLLTGSGILAETVLWKKASRWTSLWWGVSWGCALWVSWFEPLVLLVLTLSIRVLVWRGQSLTRAWLPSLGIATLVACIAIGLEGCPRAGLDPNLRPFFFRWALRIGELQSLNLISAAFSWLGCLALLLPLALAWNAFKRKEPLAWFWLALVLVTATLTAWHARWGYFLALCGALAMPHALQVIPQRWLGYGLFAVSLWPLASALERDLFPTGEIRQNLVENLYESQQLRQVAHALKNLEGDGVLSPWWLTPQLVYWSGKKGIAGSSHESLAGTIDTARFFVADDDSEAKSILLKRNPDFIVVCNADRLLDNSYTLLGEVRNPANQLAAVLFKTPSRCPDYLRLFFQNPSFKVYRVQKEMLR